MPKFEKIGELVRRFLDSSGLAERVEAASILAEWEARVGPGIAEVTRALRLEGETLIVAVKTSAWLTELNLQRPTLMARLNAGRKSRVERLIFVLSPNPDSFSAKVARTPEKS